MNNHPVFNTGLDALNTAATIIQDAWIKHKYQGERYCPVCDTYNHVFHMERICCEECGYIWRPKNSAPPSPLPNTDNSQNFSDDILSNSLAFIPLSKHEEELIRHIQYCKNCWNNWETSTDNMDYIEVGITASNFTTDPNFIIVDLNKIAHGTKAKSCLDYDAFDEYEYDSDAE